MKTIGPDLQSAMKRLRLGKLLDTLGERIALAEKEDMPIEDFLVMLLTDEIDGNRPPPRDAPMTQDSIRRW